MMLTPDRSGPAPTTAEAPTQLSQVRDRTQLLAELNDSSDEIAKLLVKEGAIQESHLVYAKSIRAKLSSPKPLLKILNELGYISTEQQRQILTKNRVSVRLGALLVELGYLRESDLRAALAIQGETTPRKKLGDILVENHFIEEQQLVRVLAQQLGFEYVQPDLSTIDQELLRRVHIHWCRQSHLLPLRIADGQLLVAFADPLDRKIRRQAEQAFGTNLRPLLASKSAILEILDAAQQQNARSHQSQLLPTNEASISELVDEIIIDALSAQASDIHVEPLRNHLRIRFRCDGVLVHHKTLSSQWSKAIANRLKILAKADIAERRRHQDGRISFSHPQTGHSIDLRVSFYVTIHGEKIVLRVLRKAQLLPMEKIGLSPKLLERFYHDVLDVPSGVILITGPTGSGKTTTLYSCVNYLNSIDRSIITAEDPVEYVIDGIAQCSLNPKIDLTFESTLPHIVRQDPDVIVMGEIRDNFSAETAIQAALTGHKVLTTFHTEDTIGALLRLLNMDIESFLVSSTIVAVMAQRLIRRICKNCQEDYNLASTELQRIGDQCLDLDGANFKIGRGCQQCGYTGYRGRLGVMELLILNEPIKDAILEKPTAHEIRKLAIETAGMITLLEDGLAKAAQGETTVAEALRHLPRLVKPRPLNQIQRLLGS